MLISRISTAAFLSIALCFSSTSAVACQAGQAGCVLPIPQSTPAPQAALPQAPEPVEVAVETEHHGIGLLPILIGLVVIGVLIFVLVDDGDDEPVSP